jgi:hypothetical protein
LLQTFFLDFLELFAPALFDQIQPETIEFLPQEYFTDLLDGDRKAIDLLLTLPMVLLMQQAAYHSIRGFFLQVTLSPLT